MGVAEASMLDGEGRALFEEVEDTEDDKVEEVCEGPEILVSWGIELLKAGSGASALDGESDESIGVCAEAEDTEDDRVPRGSCWA